MLRNYFLAAFRNLRKNRGFSILNISGLAVGIACAGLILLWIEDEMEFNHSVPAHDRIYRVMERQVHNGQTGTFSATPPLLGPAILAEIPGIRRMARTNNSSELTQSLGVGDKVLTEQGNFGDPALMSMLDLHFVFGERSHAFDEMHSIVISETLAEKLFGSADVVGRSIRVDHKDNYTVTGVFKDMAANSTIRFGWMEPFANFEASVPWAKNWGANGAATYVELAPGANPAAVDRQLEHFLASRLDGLKTECFLFPMNNWHLFWHFTDGHPDGKGDIRFVRLFSLIAVIILLIACINFMNLSTAKSAERAKEVGIRKVIGAGRGKLVWQFIGESLVLSFVSTLIAVGIIYAVIPSFNQLVGKQLTVDMLNPVHWTALLGTGLLTGIVAGSYPAFYLSSFSPISVLNGARLRVGSRVAFVRKGLVVAQFSVSILLIICTTIVYQQINFTRTRDWGFDRNNLLITKVQGNILPHFDALRSELIHTGVVENAALSQGDVLNMGWWSTDDYQWPGKPAGKNVDIENEQVTASFFETTGMKIIAGRGFRDDTHSEDNNIVINESMAKLVGDYAKPGAVIHMDQRALKIIGIVHDYMYDNAYASSAGPVVMYGAPQEANYMTIRVKPGNDLAGAMEKIGAVMKAGNPGYPFEYQFMDEQFDKLFKTETLTGRLAGIFTALAIFISCLGLFGLAAYSASRRAKEIGIRKVLGASTQGLAALLSRDFVKWVLVACVLAFPVGWWLMSGWLGDYAYRTSIHWWVFAGAGGAAIAIALATVAVQAIRAAVANPVQSLRSE
ncbi:MAG TPA: ABC transporter permease [Puia sp.]|nr:ABC transporter permease [Puia sp.]